MQTRGGYYNNLLAPEGQKNKIRCQKCASNPQNVATEKPPPPLFSSHNEAKILCYKQKPMHVYNPKFVRGVTLQKTTVT